MMVGQDPVVVDLTNVTTTAASQLSSAITPLISGAGTSSIHSNVTSAGHEIVGGVSSFTIIMCVHVAAFPQASVAWNTQVITVGQGPSELKDTGVRTGVPQLSVTVMSAIIAPTFGASSIHSTSAVAGHEIVGGVSSTTSII
jgi:hypothetical protein